MQTSSPDIRRKPVPSRAPRVQPEDRRYSWEEEVLNPRSNGTTGRDRAYPVAKCEDEPEGQQTQQIPTQINDGEQNEQDEEGQVFDQFVKHVGNAKSTTSESSEPDLHPLLLQYLQEARTSNGQKSSSGERLPVLVPASRKTGRSKKPVNYNDEQSESDDSDAEDDDKYCCPTAKVLLNKGTGEVWYCYACKLAFCARHWAKTKAHARNKPGHEKVDAAIANLIATTLEACNDQSEQARMHGQDYSASWFGAIRTDNETVFRDYGRYTSLMSDLSLDDRKRAYPALVSFVGDTGAGKSSLIKLLVKTQLRGELSDDSIDLQVQQTPVVGNVGASLPTSGDVHLYADPGTFRTERPILYADCEGLRGGTLEPVGAMLRRKLYANTRDRTRTPSFDKQVRRRHETSEREIPWANIPEKRTRKFFVENLYPRLLYTFSDVVIFVVKNAQMIEDVIEQLVIWADAVIESAKNQPVLPYAIVVLNASENQESHLWDVIQSTTALLDQLEQALDQNPKLKAFATKWTSKGFNIDSIESLLLTYYSGFRVIRIPNKKTPSLVHSQIKRLYLEVESAITDVHKEKQSKRLKLNAESLAPYLQQAFDHFCDNLNDPFDFIKASFADSGIPSDFCGNTIKLIMDITRQWSNRIDDILLFKELAPMVASCVMLHIVRYRRLGKAEALFREYMEHFDETVDDFYDKVWPCEYVSDKGRCTNVRVGHAKGHQFGKGEIVAGEYRSTSSADSSRRLYRNHIFKVLDELLSRMEEATSTTEQEIAARIHQTEILDPFYMHLGGAEKYISHTICLCCLVASAENCLPCGHAICTACVKDYGIQRSSSLVEMKYCPLHKSSSNHWRHRVVLKPDAAGTRVLSLDGGGVRGMLMLMMLEKLEEDLGSMQIQNFFELVVGTSTGGIIALGLVEMGWSVTDALKKFWDLAKKAFKKDKMLGLDIAEVWLSGYQGGRYKTEPLEELLATQYDNTLLFGGKRRNRAPLSVPCKVAVTTTSTGGTTFLLANYNRTEKTDDGPYTFLRDDKPNKEIRLWEAARCTSAAPKIFKPYMHADSGHTFLDGGIYYNNPMEIALREHNLLWPSDQDRLPDVMLSLGTGHSPKRQSDIHIPTLFRGSRTAIGQITENYKQLWKIATDHVASSLRSEEQYRRLQNHYPDTRMKRNSFKRFNYLFPPEFGKFKADDVAKMPAMEAFAKSDLNCRKEEIRTIANRLIATSFYFDVEPGFVEVVSGGTCRVQGRIKCRFPPGSEEMKNFGDLLHSRIEEARKNGYCHSPCFVVQDRSRPRETQQIVLEDFLIHDMQDHGYFAPDEITLQVSSYQAQSDISLSFGAGSDDEEDNSISGFPRCWDDRRLTMSTSRLNLSDARIRPDSRRGRPDWIPDRSPLFNLARYTQAQNPGMADDDDLTAVNQRLTMPSHDARILNHSPDVLTKSYVEAKGEKEKLGILRWVQTVSSSSRATKADSDNLDNLAMSTLSAEVSDGRYGGYAELPPNQVTLPFTPRHLPGLYELSHENRE